MTMPSGGPTTAGALPPGVNPHLTYGTTADGSIPGLVTRDQATVSAALKANVQASPGWTGASAAVWAGLQSGLPLPLAIIQALVQQIIQDVTQFFTNIGDALTHVGTFLHDKYFGIDSASKAADYANVQLAVMNRAIKDTFDTPEGSLSSNWSVSYPFVGFGGVQVDGHGNVRWYKFGGFPHYAICRYNAATTATHNQIVSIVMPDAVQDPSFGGTAFTRIFLRMNPSGNDAVFWEISHAKVRFGYMASGTDHYLGPEYSYTKHNGDSWDVYAGSTFSAYEFGIRQNGVTIACYYDSPTSPVTAKNDSHKHVGFGMLAADRSIYFDQTLPGSIAVFSADDQTTWGGS